MGELSKAIERNVVDKRNNQYKSSILGCIQAYDSFTNRATVSFLDKNGSIHTAHGVPCQIGSGGVHSAGPFEGDYVWMEFINQNPNYPKVTSLADEHFHDNSRVRLDGTELGTLLDDKIVDYDTFRCRTETSKLLEEVQGAIGGIAGAIAGLLGVNIVTKIIPLLSIAGDLFRGITSGNAGSTSAVGSLLDNERIVNISNYSSDEVGLTHPVNKAGIKLRYNGDVDMFVEGNQGVRLAPKTTDENNPNKQKPATLATWVDCEKHFVGEFKVWSDNLTKILAIDRAEFGVDYYGASVDEKNKRTVKRGEAYIHGKSIYVYSKLDSMYEAGRNMFIKADKDIDVKCKRIIVNGEKLEDMIERIAEDVFEKEYRKAFGTSSKSQQEYINILYEEIDWEPDPNPEAEGFTWPVPTCKKITCYINGYPGHTGIDISKTGGSYGSVIVASDSGTVQKAVPTYTPGVGYGMHLVIDHGNGMSSLYGHCSALLVKQGDKVTRSQPIAKIGDTGNSFGAHLHFEIRKNGVFQNPLNYVNL